MLRIYLNNENEYLDLYESESLELTVEAKDLSDPVKIIGDISKELTVPATKRNNNIFKHYHRGDIVGQIDARKFIQCTLIMANKPNKTGRISIESVSVRSGIPFEYKLRYYSDLAEMIKKLGEDKMANVDLSSYDDAAWNAKNAFNNASFTHNQAVVYPLCAHKTRFIWDSTNRSAAIAFTNTKNIAYHTTTGSGAASGLSLADFSLAPVDVIPALRVGNIIDKIENQYGLSFTGAIEEDYIQNLRLWLNKELKSQEGEQFEGAADNMSLVSGSLDPSDGFLSASQIAFNNPAPDTTRIRFSATFSGTGEVRMKSNGSTVQTINSSSATSSNHVITGAEIITFDATSNSITDSFDLTITIEHIDSSNPSNNYTVVVRDNAITVGALSVLDISQRVPDVTVKEFLRTIFEMFNLVAVSNTSADGTVNIETYHYDYFIYSGNTIDISKYMDSSDREVMPPNNYSSVTFEATNGETAIETGYLNTQERKFGYLNYKDDDSDRLSGTDYKVTLKSMFQPLEQFVDLTSGAAVDVESATFLDTSNDSKMGKLCFTYATRSANTTATRISWRESGTSNQESIQTYVVPSNVYSDESVPLRHDRNERNYLVGLHFNEEQLVSAPEVGVNGISLYNNFYKGTVRNMFDESFRRTKLKCYLPSNIITDLAPNTKLLVNGSYYLISSYTVDFRTQLVDFNLLLVGSKLPDDFELQTTFLQASSGVGRVTYMSSAGRLIYLDIGTGGNNVNSIGEVKSTYNL